MSKEKESPSTLHNQTHDQVPSLQKIRNPRGGRNLERKDTSTSN